MIKLYWRLIRKYARFYFKAKTIYDLHSPFLAELAVAVLEDRRHFYAFSFAERLKRGLAQNKNVIKVTDHGAGSLINNASEKTISTIAKNSAMPSRAGRWLFRIVQHLQPKSILELGTSLGVSTIYLALAALKGQVITLEGDSNIAWIAKENFRRLELNNIKVITGIFDEKLSLALAQHKKLDFLFLDGDHRQESSLRYFELCLKSAHNDTAFIIADIHWSDEMEAAWAAMIQHPKVTLSVDFFHFGILFFRKEQKEREHYNLVPVRWKPWRMGFF